MGLSSAIARLHADRTLDSAIRDVLATFHGHPREVLTVDTLARLSGRPAGQVEGIARTLRECFVLDCTGDLPGFRYVPDALLELDIRRYLERVDTVNGRLQDNVARFRERQGYR